MKYDVKYDIIPIKFEISKIIAKMVERAKSVLSLILHKLYETTKYVRRTTYGYIFTRKAKEVQSNDRRRKTPPPSAPGEYRIRDEKGKIVYVGETSDLNRRMHEHIRSGKRKKD